MLKVGLP